MTAPGETPPASEAAKLPPFHWCDALGRQHADVPRCRHIGERRTSWGRRVLHDCTRKGVVRHGEDPSGRPMFFCLQHDPGREKAKRAAKVADVLLELVEEALAKHVHPTKVSAGWRRRAEVTIARIEGRDAR